jgi:dihydroorotate dehydrogenase (NAD+) catalytic subunit
MLRRRPRLRRGVVRVVACLETRIGKLRMHNPVMTASGTFGYGEEMADFIDLSKLGAIVCKTVTLEPRRGNDAPRIVETPAGMLNAIGLQNDGIEAFIANELPRLSKIDVPVVANIAGETVSEYAALAERLDSADRIDAIEVNVSCPNVESGMQFGQDPKATKKLVKDVKKHTKHTVIVKLTPNVTDIVEIAQAAVAAGADSISLINTLLGMSIDAETRTPHLANVTGGLSGPAIKPVALRMVWQVAEAVDVPVIGIGGITSPQEAIEFLITGASAVQVGAGNFLNPMLCLDVVGGIEEYLREHAMEDLRELIGSLRLPT